MGSCSIASHLQIVRSGQAAYEKLARFHYRDTRLGPSAAIYALVETHPIRRRGAEVVGVIVYAMPAPALELRNIATGGAFSGCGDRCGQIQMVNENIRCIRRVIIEPRYRGLGLACRLVRETMGRVGAAVIEAMAVMGSVNPFFERAGMKAYFGPEPVGCVRVREAFSLVGIEGELLVDHKAVQERIDAFARRQKEFIEVEFSRFLQGYGRRRNMPAGPERTRYILSKLTERPVYYIWLNEGMQSEVSGGKLQEQEARGSSAAGVGKCG